jgi:hypothetical protein
MRSYDFGRFEDEEERIQPTLNKDEDEDEYENSLGEDDFLK